MTRLKRTLRTADGLAMMVGIIVGSGIFRTPGIVARQLGRPILTFVAWVLGGALAFLGTLVFAELAARLPQAGGKYVYAREAFGRRAAFVVGWVEALGMYAAAIAAIGTVGGEYLGRLLGAPAGSTPWLAAGWVALFTWINLVGVASGRWVQNVVTAAKLLALAGLVVVAFATGSGTGPSTVLPAAPRGVAVWGALAVAFRSVIWTYYGYADAAKIAEEVVDPGRTLPRIFLGGIATVIALYLLLNAAFLHVLPIERIAASYGVRPFSMCLAAPSTTTMASSTTMPIARMIANSVVRLTLNPIAAIAAKAPMMVTGTVVAGTSMARQSCRKTKITASTSSAASIRVL